MINAQDIDIGEIILHHTSDDYSFGMEPFWHVTWQKWPDLHLGPLTLNLTPTKHVIFMAIAAALVLLTMWVAKRGLDEQRAHEKAPRGFAGFIEYLVLWLRDDVAIAHIGAKGARFAPLVVGLFFFITYMNLLGLLPWGATATGNLAVTGTLAVVVFLIVEISGLMTLGLGGYWRTIVPPVPGVTGAGAVVLGAVMAPIEILGKFVKPFALAVRLFGNMTAGHFVILSMIGIILYFGSWLIGGVSAVVIAALMLLETLVAALQAYVFALLTAVFIGMMQHEH